MKTLSILIFVISLAEAAGAQDGADPSALELRIGERLIPKGLVIGVRYENSIGRRLANTMVFLFDYRRLLDNIPLGGYSLSEVRKYCGRGSVEASKIDLGTQIALVRVAREGDGHEIGKGNLVGQKFGLEDARSTVTLSSLCESLKAPYPSLRMFDLMAAGGKWEPFEEMTRDDTRFDGLWSPDAVRFMQGRIDTSSHRQLTSMDAVTWNVQPESGHMDEDDRWEIEWSLPETDRAQVAIYSTNWWRYRTNYDVERKIGDIDDFYLSYSSSLNVFSGAGLESSSTGSKPFSISTCEIGELGEVNCNMEWDSPPKLKDDRMGTFSLWYGSPHGATVVSPQGQWLESWYLLTEEPLPSGKVAVWVERDAFR